MVKVMLLGSKSKPHEKKKKVKDHFGVDSWVCYKWQLAYIQITQTKGKENMC